MTVGSKRLSSSNNNKADGEAPLRYRTGQELVAGAMAGAVGKTMIAPLDRTKIIFQTSQSRPFSWSAVRGELNRIVTEEGPARLWKGHSATLVRVMPYAAIQFSTFDYLKRHVLPTKPKWYERLMAGSTAGAISVACTYPLDLVRAQMAVQVRRDVQLNVMGMVQHIYSTRGMVGLYRGLTPTLLGILPYAGVSFAMFETLKSRYLLATGAECSTVQRLAFGAFSGFVAQALTYPLDIVRRRQQTEQVNTHHPRKYQGVLASFRLIVAEEGTRALTKAISMNAVKGPIAVGVSFATHDLIIRALTAV
ncbi:hypothetical protein BASA81_007852 [Batrachochytrium salamandrivorans]|nr:hypothetical protein BASA81_007852 [Batrachochytrium salamandrivorans]